MRQNRPRSPAHFAFESLLDRTLCMTQFPLGDCAPRLNASNASSRRATRFARLLEHHCERTEIRRDVSLPRLGCRPRTSFAFRRRGPIEHPLGVGNARCRKHSACALIDSIYFACREGRHSRRRPAKLTCDWKDKGFAIVETNAANQIRGTDFSTRASLAHRSHVWPLSGCKRAFRFTRYILFVCQAGQRVHFLSDISQQTAKQRTSGAILSRSPLPATLPFFNSPGGLFYRATRILQCRPPTRALPSRARGALRHRALLAKARRGNRQLRIL
jgi:hypothetical protein